MQSCPIFEEYRKNRMIIGYFRYGSLQSQIGGAKYDNVGSIEKRLSIIQERSQPRTSRGYCKSRHDRVRHTPELSIPPTRRRYPCRAKKMTLQLHLKALASSLYGLFIFGSCVITDKPTSSAPVSHLPARAAFSSNVRFLRDNRPARRFFPQTSKNYAHRQR